MVIVKTERNKRVQLNREMSLLTATGERYHGVSADYSLGGFFLEMESIPEILITGFEATLEMISPDNKRSIPCRVAHIDNKGVGLEVYWSQAVTTTTNKVSSKDGKDNPNPSRTRATFELPLILTLEDGRKIQGNSSNISSGGFFFSIQDMASNVRVGDKAMVELPERGDGFQFSCRIAHIKPEGFGLDISWSDALKISKALN